MAFTREKKRRKSYGKLTVIEVRIGYECFASWTFQAGISGSSGVANALQVVMPEGRTPGRHDGRDAEVRRFSPFPLCRHPFSTDDTLIPEYFPRVLFSPRVWCAASASPSTSLSLSLSLSLPPSLPLSVSLPLSFFLFLFLLIFLLLQRNHFVSRSRNNLPTVSPSVTRAVTDGSKLLESSSLVRWFFSCCQLDRQRDNDERRRPTPARCFPSTSLLVHCSNRRGSTRTTRSKEGTSSVPRARQVREYAARSFGEVAAG